MNRNKRVAKMTAMALTASVLIGSSAITAVAAPTAGITGAVVTNQATAEVAAPTSFAGISHIVSTIVASAKTEAEGTVAQAEASETDTTAVAAEPVNEFANVGIATVDDFVYVRNAASEEGEIVGKLYAKNACTVDGEENGWYKITSGNIDGYVSSEFVTVGDEALIRESSRRIATVTADILYVREEANPESSILDFVGVTEDLTVKDESMKESGWVLVDANGTEGYVSLEFVELSTEYTFGETAEEEAERLAAEEAARQAAIEAAQRQAEAAAAQAAAARTTTANTAAAPQAQAAAAPAKTYNPPSGGSGQAVVNYASQFLGNPYVWGGTSLTNGCDCSGFVMGVYQAFGVSLPHSSSADRSVGYGVSYDQMQPGDIVCYSGHVGIYVGGGTMINASTPATGIKYSSVNYAPILAIRRIF